MKTKERFTNDIEASIDAEFLKIGVNELYVCCMQAKRVPNKVTPGLPCTAMVVSTGKADSEMLNAVVNELERAWEMTEQKEYLTHYLLRNMHKAGFPGISICACGDTFDDQEGRIRAKRRLLSHLLHKPRVITPIAKQQAEYTVGLLRAGRITIGPAPETQAHTLDDAVKLEDECRYLRAKISMQKLCDALDAQNNHTSEAAGKLVCCENLVAALRADVAARDAHVAELQQIIGDSRAAVTALKLDMAHCRASRERVITTLMGVEDDMKQRRSDIADRDRHIRGMRVTVARYRATIKEQNERIRRAKAAVNPTTMRIHLESVGWIDTLIRAVEADKQ